MAKTRWSWPRAPSGEKPWHLLGLTPNFVLCPVIAELAAVFKTDAALSRVLPSPWSLAGYFPSEAIYLFPFTCQASVSHLWFYLLRGKELSLPSPPKSLALGMGSDPILGRRGSSGGRTMGQGLAGLY